MHAAAGTRASRLRVRPTRSLQRQESRIPMNNSTQQQGPYSLPDLYGKTLRVRRGSATWSPSSRLAVHISALCSHLSTTSRLTQSLQFMLSVTRCIRSSPPFSLARAPKALRRMAPGKRMRSDSEATAATPDPAEASSALKTSKPVRIQGFVTTDHVLTVPLDHFNDKEGPTIQVFAREVCPGYRVPRALRLKSKRPQPGSRACAGCPKANLHPWHRAVLLRDEHRAPGTAAAVPLE